MDNGLVKSKIITVHRGIVIGRSRAGVKEMYLVKYLTSVKEASTATSGSHSRVRL